MDGYYGRLDGSVDECVEKWFVCHIECDDLVLQWPGHGYRLSIMTR